MYLEKNRECAIQVHARQPHLQGVLSEKHRRYENTSTTKYVAMNPRQCVGCLKCVDKCPKHVIGKVCFLWHKHVVFKDADACIGCNKCVKTCPHGVFSQQSSKIWETPRFFGETSFYVAYPIFSQLKYPLFMLWTLTSIPYLFRNNCASIGRSRATPIGGIGEIVLVSMNIPFSRRCLLSLHAALPLFFTTILQSAIIHLF